jgi:heme exporter protein C
MSTLEISGRLGAGDTDPAANAHGSTSSTGTKVLGAIGLVGMGWLTLSGLVLTGPDAELGEAVRPIYVHVPSVVAAYACFFLTALGSVMWLWKRSAFWDKVAQASAEVGTILIGLCLVTGSLWGYITWGVWWTWDARLTSTLLLFLVFLGYLILRATDGTREQLATRCAAVGLGGVILVPIVHKSVDWWRSNHQAQTVLGTFDAEIDGLQLFTLMSGFLIFLAIAAYLIIHRFRVLVLEEEAESVGLEAAIAARSAELSSSPNSGANP